MPKQPCCQVLAHSGTVCKVNLSTDRWHPVSAQTANTENRPTLCQFSKPITAVGRELPVFDAARLAGAKVHSRRGRSAGFGRATVPARAIGGLTSPRLREEWTWSNIAGLTARFTGVQGPDIRDICYATQNRQSAVRHVGKLVDVTIVGGSCDLTKRIGPVAVSGLPGDENTEFRLPSELASARSSRSDRDFHFMMPERKF